MKITTFLLITALIVFSACGGKSKGGETGSAPAPIVEDGKKPETGSNKPGTGSLSELDCNQVWKDYISANRKGTISEYEVKSEYNLVNSTFPLKPVLMKQRNEIVESNEVQVVTKRTTATGNAKDVVTTDTRKSSEMIAKCEEMKKQGLPVNMGTIGLPAMIEVEKDEFITVVAGTFNCNYKKMKIDSATNGATSTYEVWSAKELTNSLMVKSIIKNQSSVNNQTMNSTTTSELIYYVIP